VIQNLLDDVTNFGFIPNGGRIYYLNRSQPPVLSEMVIALLLYDSRFAGMPIWRDAADLGAAYKDLDHTIGPRADSITILLACDSACSGPRPLLPYATQH
jgi:hypothetical protein